MFDKVVDAFLSDGRIGLQEAVIDFFIESDRKNCLEICEKYFYDNLDLVGFKDDVLVSVSQWDPLEFKYDLKKMLSSGLVIMSDVKEAKAMYAEYFYDGGDESVFSLVVCSKYENAEDEKLDPMLNDDPFWMDFIVGDYIYGPEVYSLLNCFDQFSFTDDQREFLDWYGHSIIMRLFGEVLREMKIGFPVAFARHDYPYVRFIK